MQKIFNFTIFIILSSSLNNVTLAFYEADKNKPVLLKNSTFESFDTISETIIALDSTKKKIQSTLYNTLNNIPQRKQSTPHENLKDINEYKVFINYLSIQINDYCTIIYNKYGSDALMSLPCEKEVSYTNLDNDNSSLTMNEQIESLDDELMNSLGTFDEMLLKEEEIIAMQSRKSQSSFESSSSMGNNGNRADAEKSSNKKEDNNNGESEQKEAANDKELQEKEYSEKEENPNGSEDKKHHSAKNQNERRKLDEIDDDIVARQLKEAAEKEKDPALKKKLWDEYYKYKRKSVKL